MFKKQIDGKLIDLKLEELNSTTEIVKQLNSVITDSTNNILGKYRQKNKDGSQTNYSICLTLEEN